MTNDERERLERTIEHCHKAQIEMPASASFRTRTLLQMLLIDLEEHRARMAGKGKGSSAQRF